MNGELIWFEPDLRNDDERYIYEERLGILEVVGKPDLAQHELEMNDVRRFREESPVTADTPLCAYPHHWEIENDHTKYKPGKPT